MKIQILGTGCPKCKKLEENARKAVAELDGGFEIEKVTDLNEIMEYGIMMTPGLIVDGVAKSSGGIPRDSQILAWLKGE